KRPEGAVQLIAEAVEGAEEVGGLEREDHVRICDCRFTPHRVVQRVLGRKIHAAVLTDDGRLQQLRKLDQVLQPCGSARHLVGNEHGIIGSDDNARHFRDPAAMALWRGGGGPRSPRGGGGSVSFGTRSVDSSAGGLSWSSVSATITTGPYGGVIAILLARTAHSPKCRHRAGLAATFF